MKFSDLFRRKKDTASELRPTPDLAVLLSQPVTALVFVGIVNPYGPTLMVGGFLGTPDMQGKKPLIRAMLNPFAQELEILHDDSPSVSGPADLMNHILPHLSLNACPTLLLPSIHIPASEAPAVYGEVLRRFPDARRVLELVRRFYGDPWNRVSGEVRTTFESGAGSASYKELSEPEAYELAQLLLSDEHTRAEMDAFNYAWNGAIAHAPALRAMNLQRMLIHFFHIAESCVMPHDKEHDFNGET
jgi:hypothetical protein